MYDNENGVYLKSIEVVNEKSKPSPKPATQPSKQPKKPLRQKDLQKPLGGKLPLQNQYHEIRRKMWLYKISCYDTIIEVN